MFLFNLPGLRSTDESFLSPRWLVTFATGCEFVLTLLVFAIVKVTRGAGTIFETGYGPVMGRYFAFAIIAFLVLCYKLDRVIQGRSS